MKETPTRKTYKSDKWIRPLQLISLVSAFAVAIADQQYLIGLGFLLVFVTLSFGVDAYRSRIEPNKKVFVGNIVGLIVSFIIILSIILYKTL